MEKLDLTKKHKTYFTADTKPEVVEVETAQYLSVSGKGDPSEKLFSENIQALYSTAYAVKFMHKRSGTDFIVSRLEGLWWFDEDKFGYPSLSEVPLRVPRAEWEYRLLIRLPDYVSNEDVQAGISTALAKKRIPNITGVGLFTMCEGTSVQMLHKGPFTAEPETLRQMNEFMKINRLTKNGPHHEIYLSDFNKTAQEKLRTILRAPVKHIADQVYAI